MYANTRLDATSSQIFFSALLLSLCLFFNNAQAALSQDPSLNWKTLTTEHFEIHFHDDEEVLAKKIGAICEQVHTRLTKELNWTPIKATQVIVTDRYDDTADDPAAGH